jgi:hypothetical protein
MAWHYARYCNHIAEAGKAEYNLPMFVNAWIVQPADKTPGDWPSGGPVDHVHDIWRAGAPAIDLLTPDLYLPNFIEMCARYTRGGGGGNPLFIPESRAGAIGAANAFYAIGQHAAIGYPPSPSRSAKPARRTDRSRGLTPCSGHSRRSSLNIRLAARLQACRSINRTLPRRCGWAITRSRWSCAGRADHPCCRNWASP